MKKIFTLLCLLSAGYIADAQDTLTIMSYNPLNYATVDSSRDHYYRAILRQTKPDLLAVQEITTQADVDTFYNKVVNAVFPGQFSKAAFVFRAGDTNQELYYRTSRFTCIANTPIHTDLRDINEFTLYNATAGDTLRVFVVHLKASSGSTNEARRAQEVDSLRRVTNALAPGKYFIVLGDFNIYGSAEPAYQKLLQVNPTDDGHFIDTIHLAGTWNTSSYAPYHTQSTRTRSFGGGATGGLNDRFDMILFSRAIAGGTGKISYVGNSMTFFGNDGYHYNDSINRLPNYAVPESVANALHYASDHLPMTARLVFRPGSGTSFTITATAGSHGTISPVGVVTVPSGGSQTFLMSPETGYHVDSVLVDGTMAGAATSYAFTNVQSTHTIRVVFAINHYTITATAGSHGTISPAGQITVDFGSSLTFTVYPDSAYEIDSLYVDGSPVPPTTTYPFMSISADHSIHPTFRGSSRVTRAYAVQAGWNLVSLPLSVDNPGKAAVFPSAISPAYRFQPGSGYIVNDTLTNGLGYWIQFSSQQNVSINGLLRTADTLQVSAGWNLVGSTSDPIVVTDIQQVPPAIVMTPFYGYTGSYTASDTLHPASGYWVKVSQNGRLILR